VRLPKFEYFEPKDLQEAISFLQNEPSAKILAGGTDLLVNMKHRVECPPLIVNIKGVDDLDRINQENGSVRIGGLARLKDLYLSPIIAAKLPALATAAAAVGSYHHQVMGTLAGNLCQQNRCRYFNQSRPWRSSRPTCYKAGGEICHVVNQKEICYSSYCGDVAPALLVLNAEIGLTGPGGARRIPLADLFSGDGKKPLTLNPAEILTEIVIPPHAMDGVSVYTKFANRESIDFPIVGAAFWAAKDKRQYRLAFTAVDRRPLRAPQVEDFLSGKELDAATVEAASELAAKDAQPLKTSLYSPSYKRRMMGVLFKDAVSRATRRT
jgi:4-hydroxybenzoyl-CoA reductase subunit beta